MKKLLAIILAVVMIMSLPVVATSAQRIEVSDELLNAIREEHKNQLVIEKEDVYIIFMKEIPGVKDRYILKYLVNGCVYPDDMPRIDVGRYILTTSRPLPVVFFNGKLYELTEAYEDGVLSDKDLDTLAAFEELDMVESKIPCALENAMSSIEDDDYINVRFTVDGSDKDFSDFYEQGVVSVSEAIEKLDAYYETLHTELLTKVIKDCDYIDKFHNSGISIVAVKKKNIKDIAASEFVQHMGYISDVHMAYIETYKPTLKQYIYKEVANGYNESWELSYKLIKAYSTMGSDAEIGFRIGDVVMRSEAIYSDFRYKYGIYDVKDQKFYDLFDIRNNYDRYNDLESCLRVYADGISVGDSDGDDSVTVLDATKIQRCVAKLDYNEYFDFYVSHDSSESGSVSDVDGDGEVTVLDATAIQLQLVKADK